jgi:hypothetical protein
MEYPTTGISEVEIPRAASPLFQHLLDTYASETNKTAAVGAYVGRFIVLAVPRLLALAGRDEAFWLTPVPFFDVRRGRIWVFWRRVLHFAHHRAQVGDCL